MTEKEQFFSDILTTAREGGIFWADFRRTQRDSDLSVLSFEFRDNEDPTQDWARVDLESIERSIELIMSGTVEMYHPDAVAIGEAYLELDAGQVDAELADIVVQVAAYGEIVFG